MNFSRYTHTAKTALTDTAPKFATSLHRSAISPDMLFFVMLAPFGSTHESAVGRAVFAELKVERYKMRDHLAQVVLFPVEQTNADNMNRHVVHALRRAEQLNRKVSTKAIVMALLSIHDGGLERLLESFNTSSEQLFIWLQERVDIADD